MEQFVGFQLMRTLGVENKWRKCINGWCLRKKYSAARRYILFILTIYARKFKPHIKVAVFWRESWASQISTDD